MCVKINIAVVLWATDPQYGEGIKDAQGTIKLHAGRDLYQLFL
jgi:hypothetical protein